MVFIELAAALWILGLSVWVFWAMRRIKKVTRAEVLEGLLASQKGLEAQTKDIYKILDEEKQKGTLHIQRIGLVRFNPFSDTGGAQSFTLALLDGNKSGLVMTSLYARTGHRWYIKEVINGKGKQLALSKEEQAAIKQAYE